VSICLESQAYQSIALNVVYSLLLWPIGNIKLCKHQLLDDKVLLHHTLLEVLVLARINRSVHLRTLGFL